MCQCIYNWWRARVARVAPDNLFDGVGTVLVSIIPDRLRYVLFSLTLPVCSIVTDSIAGTCFVSLVAELGSGPVANTGKSFRPAILPISQPVSFHRLSYVRVDREIRAEIF